MKQMNIYEFIQLTKNEPLKWINYCEILITSSGNIILARPSHTEALIQYACEKELKTREQISQELYDIRSIPLDYLVDKYNMIAVWYNGYMCHSPKPNKLQKKVLFLLEKSGLITNKESQYNMISNEYTIQKRRNKND